MTTTKNTFADYTKDKVAFLRGSTYREENYSTQDVLSKRYIREDGKIFYESLTTEETQYISTKMMCDKHRIDVKRTTKLEWWSDVNATSKIAHMVEEYKIN